MRLRFDDTPVARPSGSSSIGLQEEGHIDSVQDYVDTQVSKEDKYKARHAELVKLEDDFVAIKPIAMRSVPHGTKILNFVWVETIKDGCAKARWTVADVRGKETRDDVFSPTPSLLANRLFDVRALLRKENCVSADVVSAFPHAQENEDVWVRAPPEYADKVREEILAGVRTDTSIAELDAGIYIKLTANVYGRRTAGAAWRQLFEDTVCGILGYNFVRCPHEPCAYIDYKKGVLLIHHVDDIRVTGKDQDLKFIMAHHAVKFWLKVGEIEEPGSEMKYLNRHKVRSEDSMVTIPDPGLIDDIIRLLGLETGRTSPVPGKKLSKKVTLCC
jgi:hypothetical protein